ncbi:MAG: DUF1800 family protein [Anaerolineales bacterium]
MTLTRRDFLKLSGMFAAWTALASCAPNDVLTPAPTAAPVGTAFPTLPSEPLADDALIVHTLKRFTFGATPEMIEKAKRIGLNAFIEEQLFPESIPDDATDKMMDPFTTLTMTQKNDFDWRKKACLCKS